MPFYTVAHATPLSPAQQDSIAAAITRIHSTKFSTPKIFVNVAFQDITKEVRYVGGKRAAKNLVSGNVRHGPSRTQEDYADMIRQLQSAWAEVVPGSPLDRVVLNGSIVAGMEAGFMLPQAGGDKKWIVDNWEEFKKKADGGDAEMKELIDDVQERGLMQPEKTAIQQLEEALGWGDSA